jgi:hypothetical protein
MGVSLERISISAACPDDVVPDQDVVIEGRADYDLINRGADDAFVDCLVELVDSAGSNETDSQTTIVIPAGELKSFSHVLRLLTLYEQPGRIGVSMRGSAPSAAGGLQEADCGFIVTAPEPSEGSLSI